MDTTKYIEIMYAGKPYRLYFSEYQRLINFRLSLYKNGKQDTDNYRKKLA